ncbi:hypothetical protein B932_1366 [Gluconobacter oxydans H24]|nr:hypothetical protein B932_1366 [Gluconobacter oxydans H24]
MAEAFLLEKMRRSCRLQIVMQKACQTCFSQWFFEPENVFSENFLIK